MRRSISACCWWRACWARCWAPRWAGPNGWSSVAGGALLLLSNGELADLVGALGSEQGPAVEDVLPLWVLAGAVACLIAGVVTGLAMLRVVRPRPPAG